MGQENRVSLPRTSVSSAIATVETPVARAEKNVFLGSCLLLLMMGQLIN